MGFFGFKVLYAICNKAFPREPLLVISRPGDGWQSIVDCEGNELLKEWYPSIRIGIYAKIKNKDYYFGVVENKDKKVTVIRICDGEVKVLDEWFDGLTFYKKRLVARIEKINSVGETLFNYIDFWGIYILDEWIHDYETVAVEMRHGFNEL